MVHHVRTCRTQNNALKTNPDVKSYVYSEYISIIERFTFHLCLNVDFTFQILEFKSLCRWVFLMVLIMINYRHTCKILLYRFSDSCYSNCSVYSVISKVIRITCGVKVMIHIWVWHICVGVCTFIMFICILFSVYNL